MSSRPLACTSTMPLVRSVVPSLSAHAGPCHEGCQRALDHALITAPERRDPKMLARLDAVAGRVLRRSDPEEAR